jgi:hypothetical protein
MEKLRKLQRIERSTKKRKCETGDLANTDQEFGGEKLRDSKWTGESHEIRRISEYSGLVFSLLDRLVSRKTPNLTGLGTMCDELTYSIAYQQARKQGWFS